MSLADSVRKVFVPIHKEGYPFIAIAAVATVVLGLLWTPLAWIFGILTVWVCYFFRDPPRVTPVRDGLIISPADGVVNLVMLAVPPVELGLPQEPMMRISVFMNVFNCHVNRSPVTGRIVKQVYTAGLFLNAELDKASDDNERNALVIDAAGRPHRRGADRGPCGAPHRQLRQGGGYDRGGRPLRAHPLRLAARRLPAGGDASDGFRRADGGCGRDGAGRSEVERGAAPVQGKLSSGALRASTCASTCGSLCGSTCSWGFGFLQSHPMSELFPPFAPDPDEPRRRRFKPVPFRVLAPNLITLLALCLGLTAIRLAYEERLELAIYAILVAALLDGVDGRIARLLKGATRFGAELDSLSDFVNFGVAPALVLYSFSLHEMGGMGWIVALVFAIASCLRLARFNAMLEDSHRPEWQKNFFVGVPAPAGAIAALLPIYLHFVGVPIVEAAAPVVAVFLLAIAFLMVSTVPTYSGKKVGARVPRSWVLPLFVVSVAIAGLLLTFTFEMLALTTLAYLACIPFSAARFRRLEEAHGRHKVVETPSASEE